jgi:hypothetical protein
MEKVRRKESVKVTRRVSRRVREMGEEVRRERVKEINGEGE